MATPRIPDDVFVELFEKYGGNEMSRRTNMTVRKILERRATLEKKIGRPRLILSANNLNTKRTIRGIIDLGSPY